MSERAESSGTAFWGDADETEALQRYRTLVNTLDDGVYQLDAEGHFVAVNDGIVEMTEYAREELLGEHVSVLLDDDDSSAVEREIERLRTNRAERSELLEFTVQTAEGKQVRCEVRMNLLEADDTVQGIVGIVRDVTERKRQKQERLRVAQEQLEVATSAGSVGIWTWDIQENALTADEYLAESYGMTPEEAAAGAPIEAFFEPVYEEDRDRVWQQLDEAVEETGEFEAEYRIRDADDDTMWVVSRAEVEHDENGDPLRMNGAISDISERKQMEEELRESEERLQLALEAAEMGAWELDLQTEESPVHSPQHDRIFGYEEPLDDWSVERFLDHVHPDDREWVEQSFEDALETGEWEFECRIVRADDEQRWITAQGELYYDGEGEPVRAIGIVQDVTEQHEQEQYFRDAKLQLEAAAEAGAVGTWEWRISEDRFVAGPSFARTFGVDPDAAREGVSLDRFVSSIHEDDRDRIERKIEETVDSCGEYEAEYRVRNADDEIRWVVARGHVECDEDGNPVTFPGALIDITERKENQRKIEKSERRYRTLAEHFPNGAVGVYDHDLRYTLAEGAVLGDRLPSADRLEGDRIPEIFSPDTVEDLEPLFRAAVENGATDSVMTEFGGRHWQVWATPLRNADGEIFAGLSFTQDVTKQVERERELERTLDLLEKTERIADVGGWEIDPATQDVFWTDHIFDLLEVPGDEEPPLDEALDMYYDEDQPVVEEAVENALDSGDPFDVEVRLLTTSGETRWLRLQGAPETDDGVVSLRGAAQDITEGKQREQRLEELVDHLETSNERLEQFAYAASHDLQEPLRMVSSYLQLIEQRYADELDEDGEEFIEFAVDGADRMRDMIDGLLKYSRVDTRGDPFEPVDLDTIFADVREDFQLTIEENGAEITADSLPHVDGDAGQLRQMFQNLLDNAIEYSGDEPPRVHVSAERGEDEDEWVISIRDEGIGIDPDDADRVFEVFQSLHTPDDHSGTGIGLALCERIVERHGGDFWVDSEPGEGATFSFTLPDEGEHNE